MKYEVLPAWYVDIMAFMIMTPCTLVGAYKGFEGMWFLTLQGTR